tara:strand:- start:141 stop:323 length:183 start_codon:yes stop_codon:yes gene_type:complete
MNLPKSTKALEDEVKRLRAEKYQLERTLKHYGAFVSERRLGGDFVQWLMEETLIRTRGKQ